MRTLVCFGMEWKRGREKPEWNYECVYTCVCMCCLRTVTNEWIVFLLCGEFNKISFFAFFHNFSYCYAWNMLTLSKREWLTQHKLIFSTFKLRYWIFVNWSTIFVPFMTALERELFRILQKRIAKSKVWRQTQYHILKSFQIKNFPHHFSARPTLSTSFFCLYMQRALCYYTFPL